MTSALSPPEQTPRLIRVTSGEQVARHVVRLIFSGELRPNARIAREELATSLGVSRIPVREALIMLEREGWIRLEIHRGAFVNPVSEQNVRDRYELMGMLLDFSVRKALERGGPTFLDRLAALERQLREEPDPEGAASLSMAFHNTVVHAANSPRVTQLFQSLSTTLPGNLLEYIPSAMDDERRAIPVILRALRQGDAPRASAEYGRRTRRTADDVVQVMKERGLFAPDIAE